MSKKLTFLLALVFCQLMGVAQMEPFLLLEKPGKIKSRVRYYAGDEIHWKFTGDETVYNAAIREVTDSTFVTTDYLHIPIDEVEMVLIPKGGGLKGVGVRTFYAIPPLFVFSAANNAFNTGRSPLIDQEVWYISGVFLAVTGIFMLLPDEKKMRTENKWRLIPIIH